ncbi:MAG: serine/threonine protein kinase, partial [Myxococcota bacterium]|nr:serine/threonine protein kinase [Myxococcota bacterium]
MPEQALIGDRYRVLRELGRGGAGTVVSVLDERTGDEVALKQVPLAEPALALAFREELGALQGLSHPRLVRLLDTGIARGEGGLFGYYTAPLLEGVDLAEHARQRPWREVESALAEALSGLFALHRNRILHGDFTPQNVLVGARGATLIDLSCARTLGVGPGETLRGTPGFIAPEWLRGEAGDVRSDLYALGRTLRALGALHRDPLPPRLDALATRLLADDPRDRPVDLLEVFDLLDRPPPTRGPADAARTLGRAPILEQLETAVRALASGTPA